MALMSYQIKLEGYIMNVQDYVKEFEDRKYFAWDRFIPMVFMTTSKSSEIKKYMIEALQEHMKISAENQTESTGGSKLKA